MADPVRALQTSFAAGELSPALYGRVDLSKYRIGAKKMKNFFVRPHGGASNRPGLGFVAETKNSGSIRSVMIPFEASTNDTYVLEFGQGYMRVIRNGVLVLTGGGTVYEIGTPYLEADLEDLYYEQSNDILTLVHPLYQPRELARFAHDNWVLSLLTFTPSMAAPTGQAAVATIGYGPPATDYYAKTDYYVITAVNAAGEESVASGNAAATNDLGFKPNFNTISWAAVAGAVTYNVFKGRSGIYGFIGYTSDLTFRDDNITPNLGDTPQTPQNPFNGAGNWPRTVSFYQQRRIFGGTVNQPQAIFASQTGSYRNMSTSTPLKDSDAITFAIAARSLQTVLHIVASGDMIVFTPSTEFKITGGNEGVLTPSSLEIKPQSFYGSSKIRPIVAGAQILFVQAKGQQVRDIGFQFSQNRYVGDDLSILAQHLFVGRSVRRWALARAPYSLIWVVMSDGGLISLTYLREHEIWAWTQHQTDGFVEDVVTVSEGNEDAVYMTVRRFVNGTYRRYIERLRSREFSDVRDAFFVDSGLSLDNPKTITGVTVANPAVFTVTAHGFSDGDEVEAYALALGPNGEDLPVATYIVRFSTVNTFQLERDNDGTIVSTAGWAAFTFAGVVRKKFQTISGLGHLEGRRVVALVDGNVAGVEGEVLTVTAGSVTLPYKGARIHVGLPYDGEIVTLDIEPGQGTAMGVVRSVSEVMLKVELTRGLEAGPSLDRMTEIKTRSFEDYGQPNALITDDLTIAIGAGWGRHGEVYIRQKYPLPATILAHVPKVAYTD